MKVQVVVELDLEFETDGEELDYDQMRALTAEVLRTHVENAMDNENELELLVDGISESTSFLVSEIMYKVK